jgi:hypothetical protein
VVFVEVAIVEYEKKFASVWIEPLDRMRNPRWKIPQIADTHVVDEVSPLRVNRGNARGPIEHISPLGSLVPMQFTHAANVQAHVYARDILGNAKFALGHLSGPATRLSVRK